MDAHKENIQTFTAMFEGFALAVERFDVAVKDRDSTQTFVSIFEVLNWAVALDDRARKHWCPEGAPLDWAWRDRVRGAEIMRGVQYARNSIHHQWSDALELDEGGFGFPVTFPMVFFEWRWRAASCLPLPEDRKEDKHGRAVYEEHLERDLARTTVHTLVNVFNFMRKQMEPPQPPGRSTAEKLLAVQPNASHGLLREPPDEVVEATRR